MEAKTGDKPMNNETGTKLSCTLCGSQIAVTKGGAGLVHCCGAPMSVVSGQRPAGSAEVRPPPVQTDDPYYD